MTPKQAKFVREYLLDLNATQAAIRAGYAKPSARSQGQRLLTNADIAAAIAEAQEKAANEAEVTLEWLIGELRRVYRMALDGAESRDGQQGGGLRYLSAANRSIELLARITGNMVEKRDLTIRTLDQMSDEELADEQEKLSAEIIKLRAVEDDNAA